VLTSLRVVPPVAFSAPRAPFVLLVLALVGAGLVGLLLLNTAINENAFRLYDLQADQKALDLREEQLQREVATLESTRTLDAKARALGLVPAGPPAFIRLPDGRVLGVPVPAKSPAPAATPSAPAATGGVPGAATQGSTPTTARTRPAARTSPAPSGPTARPSARRSGATRAPARTVPTLRGTAAATVSSGAAR